MIIIIINIALVAPPCENLIFKEAKVIATYMYSVL